MKYDGLKQITCTSTPNKQNFLEVRHEYRLLKILAFQFICAVIILGSVFGLPKILPQSKFVTDGIVDAFKYNIETLGTESEEVGQSVFDKNTELTEGVAELFGNGGSKA